MKLKTNTGFTVLRLNLMHPFFNTGNRILFLLLGWTALSLSICILLSVVAQSLLRESLVLFMPLYFLCLIFILPNYYVCRGLPLEDTPWIPLIGAQLLTLLAITAMWLLIGNSYASIYDSLTGQTQLSNLFEDTLAINVAILVIFFEAIMLIHYLYFAMERATDIEQAALQQKLLISQAELQTLRATVHPHFLFNSLNTLSNIALSSPEQAHRFCLLMADFLRYSVAYSEKAQTTLSEELEHIQNYLGIERERFGDRLLTHFSIDDKLLDCIVPPLILFPLVENAVKHGIDSFLEGGTLTIAVRANQTMLIIEVSNPFDELGRKLKGTGHGLASVEKRLKNLYGGEALIKTQRDSNCYSIQLFIPLDHERTTNDG